MKTTPDPESIRSKIATNVMPELRPRCTTTAGNERAGSMVLLFLGRLVTDSHVSPEDFAGEQRGGGERIYPGSGVIISIYAVPCIS